jgi:uncharacterized protein involved in response to NO
MTDNKGYFLSQPHQPFFTLAIIHAIFMMLVFLLAHKGLIILSMNPFTFHAYSLIFTVFTPFFLGFLLTTFPRFSQVPAIEKSLYSRIFFLLLAGSILFIIGAFSTIMISAVGGLIIFIAQLYAGMIFYKIYQTSPQKDKHDQFWILVSWGEGLIANVLFIATFFMLIPSNILSHSIGIYLYLIMMALSVGQRMIPFFSHLIIERNSTLLKAIFILFSLYILAHFFEIKIGFFFLLIAGALMMKELLRWNLPFKQADAVLWILHLAIFWLPAALIIGGISEVAGLIFEKDFLSLSIHLVVLGFLTTIMIGFGTRVTLGHSGNQMHIDKVTKILFYLTQIVVYFRALYSFSGSNILFDITATLWMVLFISWAIKYLPVLVTGKKLS